MAFAALVGVLAMASCSSSDDYEMAEKLSGEQVYFPGTLAQKVILSSTENTYELPVMRVNTSGAVSVPLKVEYEGEALTIPTSVNFADGQSEAVITIGYDADVLGFDNFESATITIGNDEYTTIYGAASFAGTFGIPAPWTSLGTATVHEEFWTGLTYGVEIQQNDIDPQTFRLIKPFPGADFEQASELLEFRIYKAGETLQGETLTQDIVYWDYHCAGMTYYANYDDIITLVWPGSFTKYPTQDAWTHNTVLAYQENGLPATVQFAPFYYMFSAGGWDYTQNDGMFTITFPGVVIKDYSVEVEYAGKYYDASDNVYAVANVSLGDDVAYAKAALCAGDDPSEIVNGLAAGAIEGVDAANGEIKLAMPEDAASGKYTIAVVSFDENGEAQEYGESTFKYTNLSAPTVDWDLTKPMVGDYEYVQMWEGTDPGLTLTPNGDGTFTISNWGYGVDFTFTLNADNTITYDDFFTGYTHPDYGDVIMEDLGHYDDEPAGYYEPSEGVFYFNTGYYVEAGYFGYGFETFTITGYAGGAAKAKKAKASKKTVASNKAAKANVRHSNIRKNGKKNLTGFTSTLSLR